MKKVMPIKTKIKAFKEIYRSPPYNEEARNTYDQIQKEIAKVTKYDFSDDSMFSFYNEVRRLTKSDEYRIGPPKPDVPKVVVGESRPTPAAEMREPILIKV
jgi:hypothetical protein